MEAFMWRVRTRLFVGHCQSFNFVRNADLLRSWSASQAWTPHFVRSYSSNSRRSPPQPPQPPQKQEQLPFVRAAYISEKDLAHRMFFALDRPLLSLGHEQPQPAWEREQQQQQQQVWEDEEEEIEDYEEEMSSGGPLGGIPSRAAASASTGASTYSHHNHNHNHNDNRDRNHDHNHNNHNHNHNSNSDHTPYHQSNIGAFSSHAPFQHQTSSPSSLPPASIDPSEAQRIVDRFFREIDEKVEAERAAWESVLDSSIARSHEDTVEEHEQEEREHHLQVGQETDKKADADDYVKDNTLYTTNIRQKRRLKMNKHKHKKLRKRQRALRKRLGK